MTRTRHDRLPNGRKVIWVGDDEFALALAEGGGHIAALRGRSVDGRFNPYWQPPWPSFEPDDVTPQLVRQKYGGPPEGRLLASILGHSLCLGLYGPPTNVEADTGAVTHGLAAVQAWTWNDSLEGSLVGSCEDALAHLRFSRSVRVENKCALIEESVHNLRDQERSLLWQQHVSFGPPLCESGFWSSANCDRGTAHPDSFGEGASLLPNTETEWPIAPRKDGTPCDYRRPLQPNEQANDFAGFRVRQDDAYGNFVVGNIHQKFALFYIWPRRFFPWLGIWDEHLARTTNPWCKRTSVRAFEFGASPYPDTRATLIARSQLFGVPTYLRLPANGTLWVRYLLGIFSGIDQPGEMTISGNAATLVNNGIEVARREIPSTVASSPREDMHS